MLLVAAVLLTFIEPSHTLAQPIQAKSNSVASFEPDFEPNLPIISLETTGKLDPEVKIPLVLSLMLPGEAQPSKTWSGAIRIHGASSVGYPKQSFSVSFSNSIQLLELRESAHWVLNAAFIDRSLMRHKLAYDLFRSLDTPEARRPAVASRFIEVVWNGGYHGLYLLMERIDPPLLGLRPFDLKDSSPTVIYKAISHGANFRQLNHNAYELREPDPSVKELWAPLDELTRFVSVSSDREFLDPQNGIAARVDLGNAIDFHLLVLLSDNLDGIDKNFILARDAARPGSETPRFFFAPWDYDGTFGRNWDASRVSPSGWLSNNLFDRLLRDAAYQGRFARRWKELRTREFAARTIQSMIDANVRAMGSAAVRNAQRWQSAAGRYPDRLTLEEDAAQMKTWIEQRLSWLDNEIERRTRP